MKEWMKLGVLITLFYSIAVNARAEEEISIRLSPPSGVFLPTYFESQFFLTPSDSPTLTEIGLLVFSSVSQWALPPQIWITSGVIQLKLTCDSFKFVDGNLNPITSPPVDPSNIFLYSETTLTVPNDFWDSIEQFGAKIEFGTFNFRTGLFVLNQGTIPASSSIPEPSTGLLLAIAAFGFLGWSWFARRRYPICG